MTRNPSPPPDLATPRPWSEQPDVSAIESQIVLRAGHLPDCGEGAEFPWDCTCDYGGFMDRTGRLLASIDRLRAIEAAAKVVCDEMVKGAGGSRWWDAIETLSVAVAAEGGTE